MSNCEQKYCLQMNNVSGNVTLGCHLGVFKLYGPWRPILFERRRGETDYTLVSNPAQWLRRNPPTQRKCLLQLRNIWPGGASSFNETHCCISSILFLIPFHGENWHIYLIIIISCHFLSIWPWSWQYFNLGSKTDICRFLSVFISVTSLSPPSLGHQQLARWADLWSKSVQQCHRYWHNTPSDLLGGRGARIYHDQLWLFIASIHVWCCYNVTTR